MIDIFVPCYPKPGELDIVTYEVIYRIYYRDKDGEIKVRDLSEEVAKKNIKC